MSFWGQNNIKSWHNDVGYTLSDGITYYLYDNGTGLIPEGEYIPRDESNPTKCTAYLLNGDQADLQHKELVPSQAKFVESNCFKGDESGHFKLLNDNFETIQHFRCDIWAKPTTNLGSGLSGNILTKYYFSSSNTFSFSKPDSAGPIQASVADSSGSNGSGALIIATQEQLSLAYVNNKFLKMSLEVYGTTVHTYLDEVLVSIGSLANGARLVDYPITIGGTSAGNSLINDGWLISRFKYTELDSFGNELDIKSDLRFSEYITDPSNHTAYDVIGDNHATLIDGSEENRGLQDEFHWSQLGYSDNWLQSPLQSSLAFYSIPEQTGLFYYETWMYPTTTSNFALAGTTVTFTRYVGAATNGGTSPVTVGNWGTPTIIIDDVIFTGTTDGELYSVLVDGQAHKIRVENIDLSVEALAIFRRSGNVFDGLVQDPLSDATGGFWTPDKPTNIIVPASTTDPTQDALGNPLTLVQDGKSFLNTGTKLQHQSIPRVKDDFWRDHVSGEMIIKSFTDFIDSPTDIEPIDPTFNTDISGVVIVNSSTEGVITHNTSSPIQGSGSLNLTVDGTGAFNRPYLSFTCNPFSYDEYAINPNNDDRTPFRILFDARVNIGNPLVVGINVTTGNIIPSTPVVTGANIIEAEININDTIGNTTVFISFDGRTIFDVDIDNLHFQIYNWEDGVYKDIVFSDVSETDKVTNIRTHSGALENRQLVTEKRIINND